MLLIAQNYELTYCAYRAQERIISSQCGLKIFDAFTLIVLVSADFHIHSVLKDDMKYVQRVKLLVIGCGVGVSKKLLAARSHRRQ